VRVCLQHASFSSASFALAHPHTLKPLNKTQVEMCMYNIYVCVRERVLHASFTRVSFISEQNVGTNFYVNIWMCVCVCVRVTCHIRRCCFCASTLKSPDKVQVEICMYVYIRVCIHLWERET